MTDRIQEFNEYSKLKTIENWRKTYNTKKFPDDDHLIEIEICMSDSLDVFHSQFNQLGIDKEYEVIRIGILRILNDIRKEEYKKMTLEEFRERCVYMVLVLNPLLSGDKIDKMYWRRLLTRPIPYQSTAHHSS